VTIETFVLPHIGALEPYIPGKPISHAARELGVDPERIIKLASNENPLGTAPAARLILERSGLQAHRYPDMDCLALHEGLAAHLGVSIGQVLAGAGSSELIRLVAQALLAPGRSAVLPQHSFAAYEAAARSVGAKAIVVPTRDWQPDLDAMVAAIDPSVRIVFIASPNNPTGALVEPQALERFCAVVPPNVLIVLDEAYHDYVHPDSRVAVRALISHHENLFVLRTFSKVYGLAGLRVGYGIGHVKLIELLRRLQTHFIVSAPAQAAALAALADTQFVEQSVTLNRVERANLCREFSTLGIEYVPSHGNFVLINVGDGSRVYGALFEHGIVVRPMGYYRLKQWIRVTVGLPEENAAFIKALRAVTG
jgi:histidinol-phosphate aminotransferase